MTEDSAAAEPPDIRPCRISYPINTNNVPTVNSSNQIYNNSTSEKYHAQFSHTKPTRSTSQSKTKNAINGFLPIILLLLSINIIPHLFSSSPSTRNTPHHDPYTSYPANVRPRPIINTISSIFAFIITQLGIDLQHEKVQMVKRLGTTETVEACMIPVLVVLSGIFAGLTLGYFSVDQTQLQVLSISGTAKQQDYARRIMPVRHDSHLLLTTLILCNMIVNEALPEVAATPLGGGFQAVVVSTVLVVIFAEIIPQSVCSRYGLLIGANMARTVRILMYIAWPIAWPIAKLLEYILGAHHGIIYRRSELRELIKMHAAGGEGGGDLDLDTVTMAQGALDLAGKAVRQAMTPIDQVFMLPIDAKLDYETLGHVVRSGHSRVPVYQMVEVPDVDLTKPGIGPGKTKLVKKVLGSLLVKSCVLLDPEDATPLASIPINAIPSVPFDEPLTNMLNVFQEGRSHMAIVSRRPRRTEDTEDAESVMTAAAGGLRQRFMRKVAEISHGKNSSGSDTSSSDSESDVERNAEGKKKKKVKKSKTTNSSSSSSPVELARPIGTPATEAERIKAEAEGEGDGKKKKGLSIAMGNLNQGAGLKQLEQAVPADAQMAPGMVEKFFEGLEGAPLGIITLEDVLEELIGEEIYDEYDDQGGPRNAASAFVPREAALAARNAALEREKALAQATPLPQTNDADLHEKPTAASAPARRVGMPKLLPMPTMTMPKFSLGRRPASQPGKSRSGGDTEKSGIVSEKPSPSPNNGSFVPSPGPGAPTARSASPLEMDHPLSAEETDITDAPRRTASDKALNANIPLTHLDPVSAVPARLLPGGAPATTQLAPPNTASLLSEALLMERGRRRMGGGGAAGSAPGVLRMPSASRTGSAVPSRQPTPPIAGAGGITTSMPVGAGGGGQGQGQGQGQAGIMSPVPMPMLAKRAPKFKSVPTPIATPQPGAHAVDPMETIRDVRTEAKHEE